MLGRGRPVYPPLAPGRRQGRHPPPLHGNSALSPLGWRGEPGGEPSSAGAWAGPPQPVASHPTWPQHPRSQHSAPSPVPSPASSPHGAVRCGRGSAAILGRSRAELSQARAPQHLQAPITWPCCPAPQPQHLLWGAATSTSPQVLHPTMGAKPPASLAAPGPRTASPTPASPPACPSTSSHRPQPLPWHRHPMSHAHPCMCGSRSPTRPTA